MGAKELRLINLGGQDKGVVKGSLREWPLYDKELRCLFDTLFTDSVTTGTAEAFTSAGR